VLRPVVIERLELHGRQREVGVRNNGPDLTDSALVTDAQNTANDIFAVPVPGSASSLYEIPARRRNSDRHTLQLHYSTSTVTKQEKGDRESRLFDEFLFSSGLTAPDRRGLWRGVLSIEAFTRRHPYHPEIPSPPNPNLRLQPNLQPNLQTNLKPHLHPNFPNLPSLGSMRTMATMQNHNTTCFHPAHLGRHRKAGRGKVSFPSIGDTKQLPR